MSPEKMKKLLKLSEDARKASYSPYSKISVGAALMTKEGKIYTGANIESASYSPTVCAERVAFFKAVSEGERDFSAIAISGGSVGEASSEYFYPCGVCRQVMSEFCKEDFLIIVGHGEDVSSFTLGELLPKSFKL